MATDELEETPLPAAETEPITDGSTTEESVAADGPWEDDDEEEITAAEGN